MKTLVVEDDRLLGPSLKRALERSGFTVDLVDSAGDAEVALRVSRYDCMLLDLGLPDFDGLDVLKSLRARRDLTPTLVLTARDRIEQKVLGLDAGADDYMVKPFDLEELRARLRAVVRRADGRSTDRLVARNLEVDLGARVVWRDGVVVGLSPREFKVLAELMRRAGVFVSKSQIEMALYDDSTSIESNTVEAIVYALRRKLGGASVIMARGLGYMTPP
jgi:DNA-binding response OmpR family regulator